MTISLLARDPRTGAFGGATATGNLCVGGWVLRGGPETGLSASQGTLPSTLWGEAVLAPMRTGLGAAAAVARTVETDPGRAQRQLAAIDPAGGTAAFTGAGSVPAAGARQAANVIVAGNMLAGVAVLDAALAALLAAEGALADRLLAGLDAAAASGGDARGLQSAALLVVARDAPPLSLRIDHHDTPLAALRDLLALTRGDDYRAWLASLPTLDEPWQAGSVRTSGGEPR